MDLRKQRVVSGMRPTGVLHIGHYHGVLKNWLILQEHYECFFFVADWHALTSDYENTRNIPQYVREMVIDWLSAGVDPNRAHIFIQSHVPEHAELHLLLSMITPLGWLERIPSYKDTQEKLKGKDLSTYGFLGYPLLQTADVLAYRADFVPVGEDQVAHIEFSREVARRFNHLYGMGDDFSSILQKALLKLGAEESNFQKFRSSYLQGGSLEALQAGRKLVQVGSALTESEKRHLLGYLVDSGQEILPEPQPLLTKISKLTGLDGQKMSKSYGNTIGLREAPDSIDKKIKTMPTDPARVRRSDPGTPEKCPVWPLHQVYSDEATRAWVQAGCTSAGIGCLDCKKSLIGAVLEAQKPLLERAAPYLDDPHRVHQILAEGCLVAREKAVKTLVEVRSAMRLL